MRLLPVLALTGTALAQGGVFDQFNSWFSNIKNQISNTLPNPVDAGASALAAEVVQPLGMQNWKQHIWPKPDEAQEWLVYVTGGNKTCFGRCGNPNAVWNLSVPLLTALPQPRDKPTLKLGTIDCEANEILCTAWSAGPPAIWHFLTPATSSNPDAASDLRIIRLNSTTVTTEDIVSIPSTSTSRYQKYTPYEGMLHPIDGTFQKFGLTIPFGYALWALGAVPSWLMMLVISFASRQIMSKRMAESPGVPAGGAPGGQPAAAPAAAAGKGSPAQAGKKDKKKR
ncbi:uncharacterized protein HMPREF1541_10850 [Cyphellophora europaea CBS 101466]|uniref:Peptidyl-tRNA hydrolase n=1 Tax=Cyphellophora europaea (strain CBS 101466) TaxID=1220924 RepID=W2S5U8_CYPE1|nr:uncharacterized protein HMPREF1541_10850 [Cyphellophora europaea CBS 101466]ETN43985.1 hypothetical protein HMPREF1541_10850 [Cyphellophora europaea CBS 101466]